jgi:hypothetical protein
LKSIHVVYEDYEDDDFSDTKSFNKLCSLPLVKLTLFDRWSKAERLISLKAVTSLTLLDCTVHRETVQELKGYLSELQLQLKSERADGSLVQLVMVSF